MLLSVVGNFLLRVGVFFFQAEDGIRDLTVTGVQTCALPISFDGLSLAWAMARDIATRVRAFTLFATHYFELTTLATEVDGCANVHLDATEHGDGIVFLHAVKDGPADRSYGLQVAQLAGVPASVIGQARQYLEALESQRDRHNDAASS